MLASSPIRRSMLLSALALAPVLAFPAPSLGGTAVVSSSYRAVKYTAAKGEQNSVTISYRRDRYTIVDRTASMKASRGCKRKSTHKVVCSRLGPGKGRRRAKYVKLMVSLKDGDDSIKVKRAPKPRAFSIDGGAGTDNIACSRVKGAGRFTARKFETVKSCPGNGVDGRGPAPGPVDTDGDGARGDIDCDEGNPSIYNGAPDAPGNGVDENCDGIDGVDPARDGLPRRQN